MTISARYDIFLLFHLKMTCPLGSTCSQHEEIPTPGHSAIRGHCMYWKIYIYSKSTPCGSYQKCKSYNWAYLKVFQLDYMRMTNSLEDFYLSEQIFCRCPVKGLLRNHLHCHHFSIVTLQCNNKELQFLLSVLTKSLHFTFNTSEAGNLFNVNCQSLRLSSRNSLYCRLCRLWHRSHCQVAL